MRGNGQGSDWLDFYVPMDALCRAAPGAIDEWLAGIGQELFHQQLCLPA
ncbi:hypothetical protein ABH926_004608 [Catenulispora sp. GP43]